MSILFSIDGKIKFSFCNALNFFSPSLSRKRQGNEIIQMWQRSNGERIYQIFFNRQVAGFSLCNKNILKLFWLQGKILIEVNAYSPYSSIALFCDIWSWISEPFENNFWMNTQFPAISIFHSLLCVRWLLFITLVNIKIRWYWMIMLVVDERAEILKLKHIVK